MKKILLPVLLFVMFLTACGPQEYKVSYETDGGTGIVNSYLIDGGTIDPPITPTKEGFQFVGWYLEPTFETEYDFTTIVETDMTLYAKWVEIEVVRIFTLLDGDRLLAEHSYWPDEIVIFETPSKDGYEFKGWYYDQDFTDPFDSNYNQVQVILYAKFEPVQTFVYLYFEEVYLGGFYIDFEEEIPMTEIQIIGFDFAGWFTEKTYENEITSVVGSTGDQVLYVKLIDSIIDLGEEVPIDLTALSYYSYMSETNPVVTMTIRNVGVITIELFPDVAQNTVNNFIQYALNGSYENSTFHRVISSFMIQGGIVNDTACAIEGAFSSNGITNDLQHDRGVISMARTNVKNSATSQFFIVHKDSYFLDGEYATFGGMISGFNVLDYIANITTNSNDKPFRDMIIDSVTVELNGYIAEDRICAQ